jgi:hypothetical protein
MLGPKSFLLDELENIDRCLKEALRHDYGAEKARAFFEECTSRLEALKFTSDATTESDSSIIAELALQASELSALISRIERSHRGEFSWSFAQEIDRLGEATCKDTTGADPSTPLFFFFSEGGMSSYAIYAEQKIAAAAKTRIFNVVFPRTLKNHVLLHPILGHELGHAAVSVPAKKAIAINVMEILKDKSQMADPNIFGDWFRSIGEKVTGPARMDVAYFWLEELFCDLFGLVLFGPAFVGAHGTLLSALDPEGTRVGLHHPPARTRFRLIKVAFDELGWRPAVDSVLQSVDSKLPRIWDFLDDPNLDESWVHLLDDGQIRLAIRELINSKADFGDVFYKPCETDITKELISQCYQSIPPIRQQNFGDGDIALEDIDFRSILLAGWLCWWKITNSGDGARLAFVDVNRLCEQAILQQRAIRLQLRSPK